MVPRGGRSASRKNTPISPRKSATPASANPAPRRSTRSHTHEIEFGDTIQLQKDGSVDSLTETKSPERRRRGTAGQNALPTVSEEIAETSDLQHEDATDESELGFQVSDTESNEETSIESVAFRSLSSKKDDMIDALPDLYTEAYSVLSLFQIGDPERLVDLHDDLMSLTSRKSKRLMGLKVAFQASRDLYGSQSQINTKVAVLALANSASLSQAPNGSWRPDAILQLANLATLLVDMFTRTNRDVLSILEGLDRSFPQFYVTDFGENRPGKKQFRSSLLKETVQMALELRTQLAMAYLDRDRDVDPGQVILGVFYEDEGVGPLRSFNQSDEQNELPEAFVEVFATRVESIRECCSTNGSHPVDFEELEKRFPWTSFLVNLAHWAQLRGKELDTQIDSQGGVEEIQRLLKGGEVRQIKIESENILEVTNDSTSLERPEPIRSPADPKKRTSARIGNKVAEAPQLHLRDRLSAARERKSRASKTTSDHNNQPHRKEARSSVRPNQTADLEPVGQNELPPSAQVDAEVPQSPDAEEPLPAAGDDDDVLDLPPVATQPTSEVLEMLRRQARLSNKENVDNSRKPKHSFIDRQPTAQRLQFDDTQEDDEPRQSSRNHKRPAENEDDEDNDFETDTRPTKLSRNKRPRHEEDRRLVTPPLNGSLDSEGDGDEDQRALDRQLVDDHNRRTTSIQLRSPLSVRTNPRPSSSAPNPRPRQHPREASEDLSTLATQPLATQIATVNEQARKYVEDHGRANRHEQKPRRAYTEEETLRLLELIEKHGTSWTNVLYMDRIHRDGPKLEDRTQVNIKDKARNMKMDFLKARTELPQNFDKVKLGARLENQLRSIGLDV